MQGIALGNCHKSDGMIFYCSHTKQFYTSSDYILSTYDLMELSYGNNFIQM
jgi:hypothetical protein